jgi:hypothetical protein
MGCRHLNGSIQRYGMPGPSEDRRSDQAGGIAVDMRRAGVMHLIEGNKTTFVLRAAPGGIGMQFSAQQPIDTLLVAMLADVLVHEVNGLREASQGQRIRVRDQRWRMRLTPLSWNLRRRRHNCADDRQGCYSPRLIC